VQITEQFEV